MKNIKKLFLVSIFFLFFYSNAQLKETFEKASISTSNNEKIDGYIKTNDLPKLSTEICFKPLISDKECTAYNPSQIKSFQVENGKKFKSFTVKMNTNKTEITVFANLILEGKTSIYKSVYDSDIFYILRKNEINYVLQDDIFSSGDTQITRNYFRGTLNLVTESLVSETNPKIKFNEDDFIELITKYNTNKGSASKDLRQKEKSIKQLIISAGTGLDKNDSEYFLQANYRIYFPELSRSTSLNIGVNYYNYQIKGSNSTSKVSLISSPIQFQQNILNKRFRPYIFTGFNLSYLKVTDEENNSLLTEGFQRNYGISFLFGAGIEFDIYKGLMLKSEFRHETFKHLILVGIGYNFSK